MTDWLASILIAVAIIAVARHYTLRLRERYEGLGPTVCPECDTVQVNSYGCDRCARINHPAVPTPRRNP